MEIEGIERGLRFMGFSQRITGPADHSRGCFSARWAAQCPQEGTEVSGGWGGSSAGLCRCL